MRVSKAAQVVHRVHGDVAVPATLCGSVLFSDEIYYRHDGPRRYFWLLDEGAQLIYEPFGWRREWYVDLVSIARDEADGVPVFTVVDQYVDVVVEGPHGPAYRLIDLDEVAEALAAGAIDAPTMAGILHRTQAFLDRHLHRGNTFPPRDIRPYFAANHRYPGWSERPVRRLEQRPA